MTDCKTAIMKARAVPGSDQLVAQVRDIAEQHGTVVADLVSEETIPPGLDRLIVIGGDGTIIGAARQALEHGTPILGVNAGRLGILADFDLESLASHAKMIFGKTPLIREHLVLNIRLFGPDGTPRFESVAINDCVVTAGPPYRMIELSLMIDDTDGPSINGDGLIISTPDHPTQCGCSGDLRSRTTFTGLSADRGGLRDPNSNRSQTGQRRHIARSGRPGNPPFLRRRTSDRQKPREASPADWKSRLFLLEHPHRKDALGCPTNLP
jgi:hypothetical protein